MLYDSIPLKKEFLDVYSKHFKRVALGVRPAPTVQRLHLETCHIYFRALDYYNHLDMDEYMEEEDKDNIKILLEDLWLELKKSLYIIKAYYYV